MMRGRIRGSGKLARPEAAETFSDVAWRRRAGIADLIAVFEITRGRSDCSECKHLALQFVGKLPAHEISKVAHTHEIRAGTPRASPLHRSPQAPWSVSRSTLRRSLEARCSAVSKHPTSEVAKHPTAKSPSTLQRSLEARCGAVSKHP